nr:anthranilate synthase component I family protein [Lujinxingia litoralis]
MKSKRLQLSASPVEVTRALLETSSGGVLFFDSQAGADARSRWSMVLCTPTRWLTEAEPGAGALVEQPSGRPVADPLAWMRSAQTTVVSDDAGDFPFVGGVAGFWSYECGAYLDDLRVELPRLDAPLLWVGVYGAGLLFDHHLQQWWVVGASADVEALYLQIKALVFHTSPGGGDAVAGYGVPPEDVGAPIYQRGAQAAVDAIFAGDLFEVNYSERWEGHWSPGGWALYQRLRQRAPGPFGCFASWEGGALASVSPEQFLEVSAEGIVRTRPIKGTRPRGETPEEDARWAEELVVSEKDRAENVMIVDLMRNDLARVCVPEEVRVSELCGLHSFASVHHLISTVEGRLAPEADALDVFAACFPAGSITGAPKLRAMEWIAEHEASPRGPYTGSMFYWSGHGRFDSNVLIRTATLLGTRALYGAGGAVVADSDPSGEWQEACWKARPFVHALGGEESGDA